jgi:hypothetical protein
MLAFSDSRVQEDGTTEVRFVNARLSSVLEKDTSMMIDSKKSAIFKFRAEEGSPPLVEGAIDGKNYYCYIQLELTNFSGSTHDVRHEQRCVEMRRRLMPGKMPSRGSEN